MYQASSRYGVGSIKSKKFVRMRTSTGEQDRQVKIILQNYRNSQNRDDQKENKNIFINQKKQNTQTLNFNKYRRQQTTNLLQQNYINPKIKANQLIKPQMKTNRKMFLSQRQYTHINSSLASYKPKIDRRNISQLWETPLANFSSSFNKNNFSKNFLKQEYIQRNFIHSNIYPRKIEKIKIISNNRINKTQNGYQNKKAPYHQTSTIKGSKQYNQDSIKTGDNIWIVCDGHGQLGHEVSQYASNVLYQMLQQRKTKQKISKEMLRDIFIDVQRNLEQSGINISLSGSTCVLVTMDEQKIYCACLGDSMAIAIYQNQQYEIISSEHKPCNAEQAKRIQFFGGIVKKTFGKQHISTSPLRLWGQGMDQWGPGLAISRSFGDKMAQKYGLIYEPQIKQIPINKKLKCIILGSDGLFDQVKPTQMVNLLTFQMKKQKKQGCKLLTQIAKSRWLGYSDDISTIVIWL